MAVKKRKGSFNATSKKVKEPGNAVPQIIVHKLDVAQRWNRKPQEIPDWRSAIQSAESQIPRRNRLYNLYADVELDGHVEAVTSKRIDAVTDANWKFVDADGKDIEAVNQLIDSTGFDDLLAEIIRSKFWGYSILEPKFWQDQDGTYEMSAGLIPRLYYRPEIGVVAYDHVNDDGINIRKGLYKRTIMEVGGVIDLGLYMKAAPYSILKRGGLGDYAMFIQVFGNPLVDAVWDGFDENQRKMLKQGLAEMGAGGTLIRPNGTEVTMMQNAAKDTGDAHGSFLRFLNTEISKALLGTTETTESSDSSGYAQSKTHGEQDERKHDNDITFVRKVLNSRFLPLLRAAGIDTAGGRFVIQGEETELTKSEMFEIHLKMATEMNMPVDHEFMYETYGMKKPDDYDAQIKEKEALSASSALSASEGKDKLTERSRSEVEELTEKAWYLKLFERFFVKAPAAETLHGACSHHTIHLADENSIDSDGHLRRVWAADGKLTFDEGLFFRTGSTLLKGFREGWAKGSERNINLNDGLGFDYGTDSPELLRAFEDNLFEFAGKKTAAELQELNQIFRESTSFEDFYANAGQRASTYNKAWLETEYTTALLTGEAAATYERLMAQSHIFPYWMYRTVGDDLVRPAHRLLEGLVLPYDSPAWRKLFPPNGWRCRCYIVPRMAHEVSADQLKRGEEVTQMYLESPRGKAEAKAGWNDDRMANGQVFTAKQQYGGINIVQLLVALGFESFRELFEKLLGDGELG